MYIDATSVEIDQGTTDRKFNLFGIFLLSII